MSFKMTTLDEYAKVQGGFAYKSKDFIEVSEYRVLKIKNVRFGTIDYSEPAFVPKSIAESTSNWRLKEGDILISMTGSGPNAPQSLVGRVARVWKNEPDAWFNQRVGRINLVDNKKIHPDFLFYWLSLPHNQDFLVANSSGSANQANISGKTIESLPTPIVDYEISFAIAKIARELDEKIILNNQTNQTLEQIAQAIFKSWFVDFDPVKAKIETLAAGDSADDAELAAMRVISAKTVDELNSLKTSNPEAFNKLAQTAALFPAAMQDSELGEIPEGWEVKFLGEISTFLNGFAFKSKELTTDAASATHKVFKMGNIRKGGGFNSKGSKDYFDLNSNPKLNRFLIKKGDLLMSMTDMKNNVALLGHTALMPSSDEYLVNQRVGLIRKSDSHYLDFPFLYYQTNETSFITSVRSRANSGVQVNLSTEGIKETPLVVPPRKVHTAFDKQVRALLEMIFTNEKQSVELENVRDLLLPKLLSGEINVTSEVVE